MDGRQRGPGGRTIDQTLLLNAVSGIPLAVLGAYLLVRPSRPFNAFFGAFAVAWGAQVLVTNGAAMAPTPELAHRLYLLSIAFLVPQYVFLAYFVSIFPHRGGLLGADNRALVLALSPAAAAAVAIAVAPDTLLSGVRGAPGAWNATWGGLAPWLVHLPRMAAFFLALWAMDRASRQPLAHHEREQARLVAVALCLYLSFAVVHALGQALSGLPAFVAAMGPETVSAYFLIFGASAVILAAAGAGMVARGEPGLALATIALPASVAAVGILLRTPFLLESAGLWRLAAVAIVMYAILRWQLFDLDVRLRRAVPVGAGACAALLSLPLLAPLRAPPDVALAQLPLVALAVAGIGLGAGLAADRLAAHLWPDESAAREALYRRKLEVYQATMIQLLREGNEVSSHERTWLSHLQRSLGLSDRECRVIEALARAAVKRGPPAVERGLHPQGLPDKYVVHRVLGHGTFGRVYLATDSTLQRRVVVKQLLPPWTTTEAVRAAFLREARILARVRHPNVVSIHDVVAHDDDLFLVTEYVEGGTLDELVAREGPLPPAKASAVIRDVLGALAAIHVERICHRDIKPANVLLDARGRAKLADFGIAHTDEADPSLTSLGLTPGTPHFMAPEQAIGGPVDARSDLYAVAAMFHYAITGRPYLKLEGRSVAEVRNAIAVTEPDIPAGQPAWVERFLAKGLSKDPARRFQSAAEMAAFLSDHARSRAVELRTVLN
ncbi:MAG TPA: serine/threonine-protein kinase [Candidatus Thermoplasmatota archaeon]|nr:serine/threonine-protein kinase [Candidatus Thermoplasmatota archaeon]